jgi:endoglucanase
MFCSRNFLSLIFLCLSLIASAQTLSKYIVIDQFGYLPSSKKIAVLRDPVTGYDATESFTPGISYAVVNVSTGSQVHTGSSVAWNGGATDASSGDRIWWLDFSTVTTPGTYYILDVTNNLRSYEFVIAEDVYKQVLKHAVRTFFYQRAGFAKSAAHAGAGWADGASHLGTRQDKQARQYNQSNNAATELDLSGGWYDAGDYNKYSNWTANYIVDFMRAYLEAPGAWGDDYGIAESGNHIPDILDEAKWGIDHLLRMQRPNGSVLSIVGLSHASPPSAATGPSLYGTPSTSATLNSAAAFAIASKVFATRGMKTYSEQLKTAAINAWNWAVANPNVIFNNNDSGAGTGGLGAGNQETDDYGRLVAKIEAACFLFDITGENTYKTFFDTNYNKIHLIEWSFAYPFETSNQEILLYYTTLPTATTSVVNTIKSTFGNAMNGEENFPAFISAKDPYRAHIKDYTWGSNSTKSLQGLMFHDMIEYDIDATKNDDALDAAEGFIHYLHGVNPFNMVYLSNMNSLGAENSVNEFYHSWFTNGSEKWDRVGASTFGPPPGFVTGGPNPSYDVDGCCLPTPNCGASSSLCNSEDLTPPKQQPAQKSYKDFNTSWPVNSWSVTENSDGYQINYIRLLSKFVPANYDCSGTLNGTASFDVCQRCSGGMTGIAPITDIALCEDEPVTSIIEDDDTFIEIYPNPVTGVVTVENKRPGSYQLGVVSTLGLPVISKEGTGTIHLNLTQQPAGIYFIQIYQNGYRRVKKITKY